MYNAKQKPLHSDWQRFFEKRIVLAKNICYNKENKKGRVVQGLNFHKKKMIAPIVVTTIMILYFILYFGFLIYALEGVWKYLLGIVPLGFSAITLYVCIERINEIKKGEEDDISKY